MVQIIVVDMVWFCPDMFAPALIAVVALHFSNFFAGRTLRVEHLSAIQRGKDFFKLPVSFDTLGAAARANAGNMGVVIMPVRGMIDTDDMMFKHLY